MKEKFSAFYRYSTEEELKKVWNDEKTLFVFDTNILLSIYSYNTQARDTFFSILESLNGRVWLPFHVVLEYQRNRIKIIKQSSSNLENLKRRISDLDVRLNHDEGKINSIENDFHQVFEQHKNIKNDLDQYIVIYKDLLKKTKTELSQITKELFAKFNNADIEIISVDGSDPIRNKFDEIFSSDKVGDCLFKNDDEIKKFNDDANLRFENKIPPGFKDENTKGDSTFIYGGIEYYNKFGDLIIFKELIEKAKSNNNKIYNLIFVTDDSKDDWIEATQVNDNKVKIGVLSHLKEEFLRESHIKDFMIIDQELFAENSNKYISSSNFSSVENLLTNIKQVKAEKENILNETVEQLISEAIHGSLDSLNENIKNNKITNIENSKSYEFINANIDEYIQSLEVKDERNKIINISNKKVISSIEKDIYNQRKLDITAEKLINFSTMNSYFNSKIIEIETNRLSDLIRRYSIIANELSLINIKSDEQINTRITMNNDIALQKEKIQAKILNLRFRIFNLLKDLISIIKIQLDVDQF